MFRNKIIFLSSALAIACIGMVAYLVMLDPEDAENYQRLMVTMDSTKGGQQDQSYTVKQQRKGMVKHLLYNGRTGRLQVQLNCDRSDIILDHSMGETEAVERLKGVQCWLQEELSYDSSKKPIQTVEYLEADAASYHYHGRRLLANQVKLSRFILPGHQLDSSLNSKTPLATGRADWTEVPLQGGAMDKEDIVLSGHVEVEFNTGDKLYCDRASVNRITMKAEFFKEEEGICRLTDNHGNVIDADRINGDIRLQTLLFFNPKGNVTGKRTGKVEFSAGRMFWDIPNNRAVLQEHVLLEQEGYGSLTANGEISLFLHRKKGEEELQRIQTDGKTVLNYVEKGRDGSHTLTSYGRIIVDYVEGVTMIESPRNEYGQVVEGKQVNFQDGMGIIDADQVLLTYAKEKGSMQLKKLKLEGHVRILNKYTGAHDNRTPLMQYALADWVEYIPETAEMILGSNEGSRVLFFDRVNRIQVSAPELKVKRHPDTKKESVQGKGDVRFTLMEQEMEQLRKCFNMIEELEPVQDHEQILKTKE